MRSIYCSLIPLLLAPAAAAQQTVLLVPTRDNTLIETPAGNSNAQGPLFSGRTSTKGRRRALLRFDIAGSVPAGARILTAALDLSLEKTSAGSPAATSLHRVSADWGEGISFKAGGSGATGSVGDATWTNRFKGGARWASPGGDFAATASATTPVSTPGSYQFTSALLAADLQAWLDRPATNFGWILITDESGSANSKRWHSRESAIGAPPRLTITFQPASTQKVVTIQPRKDNCIFETPAGNSSGQGPLFTGRTKSAGVRRALLAFDVAKALPAGSRILSAQLTMKMTKAGSTSASATTLHRLQADWGEGTSNSGGSGGGKGMPATTGDATWIYRFLNTSSWTARGGDFLGRPSASQTVGGTGTYSFPSTATVLADVQGWLDRPATNFGWLVRTDESTPGTARSWASREATTAADRPTLVIVYDPNPKASYTIFGDGCPGAAGIPLLQAAGTSRPVLGGTFQVQVSNIPASPGAGVMVLGFSSTSWFGVDLPLQLGFLGLQGCNLLASLDLVQALAPTAGSATWKLSLPNDPFLTGLLIHNQAIVLDPNLGARVSNGGRGWLGS